MTYRFITKGIYQRQFVALSTPPLAASSVTRGKENKKRKQEKKVKKKKSEKERKKRDLINYTSFARVKLYHSLNLRMNEIFCHARVANPL